MLQMKNDAVKKHRDCRGEFDFQRERVMSPEAMPLVAGFGDASVPNKGKCPA